LLAHDLRWKLVTNLIAGDYRVQELVDLTHQPFNLISYHLRLLRGGQVVTARRSDADGRDIYYGVDLERLGALYQAAGAALHPALTVTDHVPVSARAYAARVLFLCTHNSARSQMAEGLLRHLSGNQFNVASAGSHPTPVHPLAVETMAKMGIDISGQSSTHLDEFRGQSFDYVITVCDQVREVCPVFPDHPATIHWSIPDPAAIKDDAERAAFEWTARQLAARIRFFLTMVHQKAARQ
jgi:protein-tyrosine-phosphatase